MSLANDRFQRAPGFTVDEVPALKLKWAFGFEGEANAAANPTVLRITERRVKMAMAVSFLFAPAKPLWPHFLVA